MKKLLLVTLALLAPGLAFGDNVTFCYHKFSYAMEDIYSTLPEVFEWQVEYIKQQGIPVIRQQQLVNAYNAGVDPGENILLTVDDGWKSVRNILPILDRQRTYATFFLYPVVIHPGARQYLNPDELHQVMQSPWVEFGCHSYTHPVLTKLNDKQLFHEVVDSRNRLEDWLGVTLNTFAYPFGMLNKRVEGYCGRYYSVIFGVNDGFNNAKTNKYNLNRFVLYRNTTFGEFADLCGFVKGKGRERPFKLVKLGRNDDYGKKVLFPKIRYFKFAPKFRTGKNALFVPGTGIGAGWMYKTMRSLLGQGVQCGVIVNRNNNIPFYRPEKNTMKVLQSWGFKEYMDDMTMAFDLILAREKKTVIITWGDGFDLVMAVLASTDKYARYVKGVVVINPSLNNADTDWSKESLKKNMDGYDAQLAAGEYAAENLNAFLRIKTLADMVFLKPDSPSVFAAKLGYTGNMTNKEVLARALAEEDNPDLGLDYGNKEYTFEDFKEAFMQPVPLFSMVIPIAFLKDLNTLWYDGFVSEELGVLDAKTLAVPVSYVYSDSYAASVGNAKATFACSTASAGYQLDGTSTIEIMLSNNVAGFVAGETGRFLQ